MQPPVKSPVDLLEVHFLGARCAQKPSIRLRGLSPSRYPQPTVRIRDENAVFGVSTEQRNLLFGRPAAEETEPDAIPMEFKHAQPILITLGDDIGAEGMPAILHEIPFLGLLTQRPGLKRAFATTGDTKRQREHTNSFNAMFPHHPFHGHNHFLPDFLPAGRQTTSRRLAILLFLNAVIIILTRKGRGGRGFAALRLRPLRWRSWHIAWKRVHAPAILFQAEAEPLTSSGRVKAGNPE